MDPEFQSSDESDDEEEIFRDFDAEAQKIVQQDLLPKKSADRYLLVYNTYKKWEADHENMLSSSHESNLIVYFKELQQKLKPPTLWSIWSMLKKTLNSNDAIDITQFLNLKCLLSNNAKGYKPKKSAILKWKEVEKFINEAMDFLYLSSKVNHFYHAHILSLNIILFSSFFYYFLGHSNIWNMWGSKV